MCGITLKTEFHSVIHCYLYLLALLSKAVVIFYLITLYGKITEIPAFFICCMKKTELFRIML